MTDFYDQMREMYGQTPSPERERYFREQEALVLLGEAQRHIGAFTTACGYGTSAFYAYGTTAIHYQPVQMRPPSPLIVNEAALERELRAKAQPVATPRPVTPKTQGVSRFSVGYLFKRAK